MTVPLGEVTVVKVVVPAEVAPEPLAETAAIQRLVQASMWDNAQKLDRAPRYVHAQYAEPYETTAAS